MTTRQIRPAALTATLGLAAASWVVAVRQMDGMDMGVATELGSFAFFVASMADVALRSSVSGRDWTCFIGCIQECCVVW